jgi:hypothetical protein
MTRYDDPLELLRWSATLGAERDELLRRRAELEASEVGDLVSPLEASTDGHTAYPPGACSPTHKDGCLRCAELELDTAEERLRVARAKLAKLQGLEP